MVCNWFSYLTILGEKWVVMGNSLIYDFCGTGATIVDTWCIVLGCNRFPKRGILPGHFEQIKQLVINWDILG